VSRAWKHSNKLLQKDMNRWGKPGQRSGLSLEWERSLACGSRRRHLELISLSPCTQPANGGSSAASVSQRASESSFASHVGKLT
jgi:hypothetical protein